jgi:hypothetical protein
MSDAALEIVTKRYRDAYLLASGIVSVGGVLKVLAFIAAVIIFLGGVMVSGQTGSTAVVIAFLAWAALVGAGIYICGMLVAALGQLQLATLDVAVNSSPILSVADKVALVGGSTARNPAAPGTYEISKL